MPIKRFFSTFLSKITKYNLVHSGFDPSVARLLGHDPTPRPPCPVNKLKKSDKLYYTLNKTCLNWATPIFTSQATGVGTLHNCACRPPPPPLHTFTHLNSMHTYTIFIIILMLLDLEYLQGNKSILY